MRRRSFLQAGASLALTGAGAGLARAGAADLRFGQLRHDGLWSPRPNALRRLAWEIGQRTSIEVDLEPSVLDADAAELFRHPLLYLSGTGAFGFSEAGVRQLRRHLTFGGMLLVDSADARPGGPFDQSVRALMGNVLPRGAWAEIPNEHVIYKSFYLVPTQAGRVLRVPSLEGVLLDERYAVVYCQNDLGGAWARDAFGRWEYEVTPGGERQREMAFRLGVNIAMYSICLDYKDDLVHTPFILRRRR
ncbi:MAG: DUF4159 domain-containing protein [Myxococcota bacterium]